MAMNRPRSRRGPRGKFAERLREARAALGITQAEAARALSVSALSVARWETGSQHPRGPALRFVELWIARALREE
jgi:DNA-binding transcriptional regulator YiaG